MKTFGIIALCCGVLAGTGCSSNSPQQGEGLGHHDPAVKRLVSISETIMAQYAANDRLASARYGVKDAPRLEVSKLSPSLRRVMSFPGGIEIEIEPFILKMSELTGYDFLETMGVKPITPIIVNFPDKIMTLGEYITHAGYMAGHRADVILDDQLKTIQLVYK